MKNQKTKVYNRKLGTNEKKYWEKAMECAKLHRVITRKENNKNSWPICMQNKVFNLPMRLTQKDKKEKDNLSQSSKLQERAKTFEKHLVKTMF